MNKYHISAYDEKNGKGLYNKILFDFGFTTKRDYGLSHGKWG